MSYSKEMHHSHKLKAKLSLKTMTVKFPVAPKAIKGK